jgi:Ca2+-binding EF-hand superfamily protein
MLEKYDKDNDGYISIDEHMAFHGAKEDKVEF